MTIVTVFDVSQLIYNIRKSVPVAAVNRQNGLPYAGRRLGNMLPAKGIIIEQSGLLGKGNVVRRIGKHWRMKNNVNLQDKKSAVVANESIKKIENS